MNSATQQTDHFRLLQIFNRPLGAGGEELAVARISQALARCCQVRNCTFQSADWVGDQAPPLWKQAAFMLYHPAAVRTITEASDTEKSQAWIVHNVIPVASLGVYREARRRGVPIIQFAHNFRPFSTTSYLWADGPLPPRPWAANYLREIRCAAWQDSRLKTAWLAGVLTFLHVSGWLESVKAWVAVSEFVRQIFMQAGIPPERVFALRHAWKPLPEAPQAAEEDYYLFLGRLIEAKGVKTMVEAWERLRACLGDRTPKLCVAGDGPLASWMGDQARLNPCLRFLGHVSGEKKERLLTRCRGVIVPSLWWEPLGLVVYEAYDHAKPVLAAASGGLTETVRHRLTGLQHAPGNAAELAGHVQELEADADQRRQLGVAGREWLLTNASEDAWRQRFHEIVRFAVTGR